MFLYMLFRFKQRKIIPKRYKKVQYAVFFLFNDVPLHPIQSRCFRLIPPTLQSLCCFFTTVLYNLLHHSHSKLYNQLTVRSNAPKNAQNAM